MKINARVWARTWVRSDRSLASSIIQNRCCVVPSKLAMVSCGCSSLIPRKIKFLGNSGTGIVLIELIKGHGGSVWMFYELSGQYRIMFSVLDTMLWGSDSSFTAAQVIRSHQMP